MVDVTPLLWSKLLADVSPQCAQSSVPRVLRVCVPEGVANDPASDPLVPPDDTTSVTVVGWLSDPLVPVMVSVELPTGVLPLVVTVMVVEPVPVTVVGLKLAPAPVGNPLTLNPVLPLNPFCPVTFTV